uniref:Uncharacterized protein n=1 Tax=Denticeps clupeoides TaxID=299321 RepID=A0AAY4E0Y0_9TELE
MLEVEMLSFLQSDEELGAVCVPATVCHGEEAGPSVFHFKVFIFKFPSINGPPSSAILLCDESTHLTHIIRNDPVENVVAVSKASLSSTEDPEGLVVSSDVEEHQRWAAMTGFAQRDLAGTGTLYRSVSFHQSE